MLEILKSVEGFGPASSGCQDENALQMKHPKPTHQTYEFNLGKALELRCTSGNSAAACNKCESCGLVNSINLTRSWFPRLGDQSKRRFLLGLVRRFHSVDLLQYISHILQPLLYKDFTYARTRTNPSLGNDSSTVSNDRALDDTDVDRYIFQSWEWFGRSNYWSKSNFILMLLQLCDSHLLYNVGIQANTLLASEEKAAKSAVSQTYTEADTIAESEYSFDSNNNSALDLLAAVKPSFSSVISNPLTGYDTDVEEAIENNDSGDESLTESQPSTIDPTILVIPSSAKAHSGVSRYRDFIRSLPVHLGKYILSKLDKASLYNALCVSRNWRKLAEEVHQEFYVNQQLLEEVMLMQGGASQGADPSYAKDIDILIPNINTHTFEVITTKDQVVKQTFKSEINYEKSFSGISTRKVIMEERNVYCGAYNVMVLKDAEDPHREVHTDGGKYICIGSKDRKVRLLDAKTGRESGPLITGHAGSVRSVFICEQKNIVISGSYDTSIRVWNIETGQCLKILRGHRDTVLALTLVGDTVASGAKDCSCKIWNILTGKCLRSFRHKEPVGCVAMGTELCITGCDGGKVKVWDLKTGNLIKRLNGHHGPITGIKFDRWHIVTASKDCYALVWSSQGDFSRCLAALRHQKEVLCLEFMYLRVITGSADGRLRIWNMVTGQCCRIMRGNSRSDPILSIIAVGDRITLNTQVNLLVLNFEKVTWDYTMENDKVPPLVQYGKYSDAPARDQPYPYVRAQRMKTAGATNTKILKHGKVNKDTNLVRSNPHVFRVDQIPHSTKMLSAKSLQEAKMVQSGIFSEYGPEYSQTAFSDGPLESWAAPAGTTCEAPPSHLSHQRSLLSPLKMARAMTVSAMTRKSRPHTTKSAPHVSLIDPKRASRINTTPVRKRRVSWAFESPLIPKSAEISLSETKSLLRSQIRMKDEHKVPPDFIYLSVNAIQSSMKPTETNINTAKNMQESMPKALPVERKGCRPSSSPSRIDPRTRVAIEDLGIEKLRDPFDYLSVDGISEAEESRHLKSTRETAQPNVQPPTVCKEVFSTSFQVKATRSASHFSTFSDQIPCSLPKGRTIRPQTSVLQNRLPPKSVELAARPVTAIGLQRPTTQSSIASALPGLAAPSKQSQLLSSSKETSHVPMLMYSKQMKKKITDLKDKRQKKLSMKSKTGYGNVSEFNDPLRSHAEFALKTFQQEERVKHSIDFAIQCKNEKEQEDLEKERRTKWLMKAKGIHK